MGECEGALSFLRMDAGYRLEQPDEPLDGTDGE